MTNGLALGVVATIVALLTGKTAMFGLLVFLAMGGIPLVAGLPARPFLAPPQTLQHRSRHRVVHLRDRIHRCLWLYIAPFGLGGMLLLREALGRKEARRQSVRCPLPLCHFASLRLTFSMDSIRSPLILPRAGPRHWRAISIV